MADIVRTAGCACGQLTLTAEGEPERVGICHCLTCRKTTGSVFSVFVIFWKERVRISGRFKGWQSSPENERCFCPVCGSQVFDRDAADEIEIKLGTFDEPNLFRPAYESWIGRKEAWLHTDDLPGYEQNRSADN